MIERHVYIKLTDEHATDAGRAEVVARTLEMFPRIDGVVGVASGKAVGDDLSKWDVCIAVQFERIEDVEPYRTHPVHLEYIEFLRPRMDCLKAWNFEVERPG
jgi:hypothetical protein